MTGPAGEPRVAAVERGHVFDGLLGVRSSKGRYYREYRHSTHDLQRTLVAVNAVSLLLADSPGDADYLVRSTLPFIAQLLGAKAVVLVSEHPGLGGRPVCVRALHPSDPGPPDEQFAEVLVRHAEEAAATCPPTGVMRAVPELSATLLLAPLPRSGRGDGYVVAAVPTRSRADGTDLAILGTLTNQLAGAIESRRRLAESEALRRAADDALHEAAEQARALAQRNLLLKRVRQELRGAREGQVLAEERQRIARDLHDSVAQHVLSMGMQVEWCRTSSDQLDLVERLTEVKELARSTVDRIRQAIFELSRDELAPHGLVAALRRLAQHQAGHGLAVGVRVIGPPAALPAGVERALYMVVREALFNTVIHAEATRASVHVVHGAGEVRVRVTDNGRGRAAELRLRLEEARQRCTDGYHRGLANIDERVRLVDGRLSIADASGGGVRLEVCVPLAAGAG